MTSLRLKRLDLSVWPFGIIFAGEILGSLLVMRWNSGGRSAAAMLGQATLSAAIGLAVAAVAIVLVRRLVVRSRSARWRSLPGAIAIYAIIAAASGAAIAWSFFPFGAAPSAAPLAVVFALTRPVNIIVLAFVVQQVRDARVTSAQVHRILAERLNLARRTNAMLETAEHHLRAESRRLLEREVAMPLRTVVREGASLSDEDLAGRLDAYMTQHLRPMAQVLHPVSVRLGLIPAMRSFNPHLLVDATTTIERMDADGMLLDDDVRLQVYRWVRENLAASSPSRASLALRKRQLEIAFLPAAGKPLDAVQVAAGLRIQHDGVITAPLRGQAVEPDELPEEETPVKSLRGRYRLRELLTVPLPQRILLVALLGLGAAPLQFLVYRWPLAWQSISASLALAVAAAGTAAVLGCLPPPKRTLAGALRVVGEWTAIAMAAALGLMLVSVAVGLAPALAAGWLPSGDAGLGVPIFRMAYRFAVPGLLVTFGYGLVVTAQERLSLANAALSAEEDRRVSILAESHRLDRDVAEALHRTVQGRLAAAVIMLRIGQRDEAWTQIVDMATVEIPLIFERIGGSGHEGALRIEAPPGITVTQIGFGLRDPRMISDVGSVVSEIAVNARRHGEATVLVVQVESRDDAWRIVCEDDGPGPRGGPPGLGSRLLDETVARYGGTWTIGPGDTGCRVTLELPRVSERGLASASR